MRAQRTVHHAVVIAGLVLATASCGDSPPPTPLAPSAVGADVSATTGGAESGGVPTALAASPEQANVMNQGGAGVYAPAGAMVVRQRNGLRLSVRMPTPEPGSYVYPDGTDPGHPEIFTLWAFIFNYPDLCDGPCDGNDIGADAPAKGSVYNAGGHVASGNSLTIAGRVGVGEPAVAPPGVTPTPLVNPAGAEIHLAVTSHGELDPTTLPEEFHMPTGSPACGCWWVALFPVP
jgi:hypothetical protein